LHWDGKDYVLDGGDGQGNAIHGFVHERSWRVLRRETSLVVGQFHASRDDAAILEKWPADFRITATYEVGDNRLSLTILLENPDARALPCGFGAHPYFRVPLGGVAAEKCRVRLPVASSWELVDMNATGRLLPVADASVYQRGQEFGSMQYDNVFSGLVFSGEECCASIEDPESGRRVVLSFDRAFRECVVYTPPHREAICIEPYTCVPDAFRLARQGIDAGLRVLAPGESFLARMAISVP
jgi:aldose 1-epimerase